MSDLAPEPKIGDTPNPENGSQLRPDLAVACLDCGWKGWHAGATVHGAVCPKCGNRSLALRQAEDGGPQQNDAARLEYLRGEIRAQRISYGEVAELQGMKNLIDPGDVELLQWAGVPEHREDPPAQAYTVAVRYDEEEPPRILLYGVYDTEEDAAKAMDEDGTFEALASDTNDPPTEIEVWVINRTWE